MICLEEQLLIKYYVIKHLILLKSLTHDGHQRGVDSVVYKSFDKKASGGAIKNEIISIKN